MRGGRGNGMRQSFILLGTLLGVASCNQAADSPAANATNTAAAEKAKPKYCFFKDSETKAWSASRDKDGNVIDGSAERVTDITDVWTFARDVSSRDPNWKLVATEAGH